MDYHLHDADTRYHMANEIAVREEENRYLGIQIENNIEAVIEVTEIDTMT
jgi:hypothetical protein